MGLCSLPIEYGSVEREVEWSVGRCNDLWADGKILSCGKLKVYHKLTICVKVKILRMETIEGMEQMADEVDFTKFVV